MKKVITLLMSLLCLQAQDYMNLMNVEAKDKFDNIKVIPLNSDDLVSTYIIFVKKMVKAHIHKTHTENIYVLAGEARMIVGDKEYNIKKGDYLYIQKNTIHSVVVTSDNPLKVLSIQSPKFLGKDRVFVD